MSCSSAHLHGADQVTGDARCPIDDGLFLSCGSLVLVFSQRLVARDGIGGRPGEKNKTFIERAVVCTNLGANKAQGLGARFDREIAERVKIIAAIMTQVVGS
jgi:hypothetical protein